MRGVNNGSEPADLSAALRESEERLRLIQAAARIGSFDWDMRTGRIFRSPEYLQLHGLPPDTDIRGDYTEHWLARVHPDDRAQVEAWFREDIKQPCDFAREYRIVRADTGEVRWLYNRGRFEGDADGQPIRMVSAQTDITERKLGELRSGFVAGLAEILRAAPSALDAMRAASEHIGRSLNVSLVGFAELDESEDWAEVRADWTDGSLPSRIGRHKLRDYGSAFYARLRAGEPVMIADADARLTTLEAAQRKAIDLFGVKSALEVPILRGGRLVALLALHHATPRRWTRNEIDMAKLAAERTSDAVERARAEDALRQSEERMRLAIIGTGLGHYDLDMVTGEGIWSDTAFAMLGLEPPPDRRASFALWEGRIHPDDLEATVQAHREAEARGGPWVLENRVVQADSGQVRWLNTFGQFVGSANARRSVGIVVDITDRKLAELRQNFLLRVSDQLRNAVDIRAATEMVAAMLAEELAVDTAGFAQIDADGGVATILSGHSSHPELQKVRTVPLGSERGPLRGAAVADLSQGRSFVVADIATDPRTSAKAEAIRAASGAAAVIQVPVMRSGRIGAVLFVHSATPRAWTDHEIQMVQRVAGRTWETIERLRAELALQRANAKLADDVRRAVEEREAALAQLHHAQKLETIGQLTGGIAHDFNNLLTPITGALDLLRHRFGDDPRLSRLIGGALQSADRARVLVQRLLGFARRQPLQPVAVDIEALLDGMRDLISGSVGRGVETRIECEPHLPCALADLNQLELAILNLCVNARDAMPEGGTLTVQAAAEVITDGNPQRLSSGDYVRISVADSGIGMDADTLRLAVEPFFSTKAKERGTGLGLSMVHGLAGQLGGAMVIDSALGVGTRVELWLPAATEAAPARPVPAPAFPHATRSLSVLLVDDEDLVRASTAEMLRDLGHQVEEAGTAAAALEKLGQGGVDVIVTDYMMPVMDGVELAERASAAAPDTPVLLITGFIGAAAKAAHLPRLAKPFGRDELAASLARIAIPVA